MRILHGKILVEYVGTKEDPYDWKLQEKIIVVLSNKEILYIPEGFITDFATVPRRLWSFVSPIERYNLASIIHDYIYTHHNYTKETADQEFLNWLNFLTPNKRFRNKIMYLAVKFFGRRRWNKYNTTI